MSGVCWVRIEYLSDLEELLEHAWTFGAMWEYVRLYGTSLYSDIIGWRIWCDYQQVKYVEQLVKNKCYDDAFNATLYEGRFMHKS
jgi:hypothetical protein